MAGATTPTGLQVEECVGLQVPALRVFSAVRSSAARAAHRELRSLLHLFRASNGCVQRSLH